MIQAVALRTEYLENPIGIDIRKPRISWKVEQAVKQTAYEVRVSINGSEYESQGLKAGDEMRAQIQAPLNSCDIVKWQVRLTDEEGNVGEWSEPATFEMGLLERGDWKSAWIMGNYEHQKDAKVRYPVDCFRKTFGNITSVKRARLYITACGMYEAKLNGRKVGDQVLTPGSTAFGKRVHYQTYDVTELLQNENILEVELADGFYAGRTGVFGNAKTYGVEPKLLAQLEITGEDGRVQIIATNKDWAWSNDGPVRLADMKDGEVVDTTFHPSYGGRARETSYDGVVCCSNNVPVQEMERLDHPKVIACPDGKTVLDFGQNIAGYMEMRVEGQRGHKCSMVFGEKLDEQGNFTYVNISWEGEYDKSHFQTNDFICDGTKQRYKPRFTVMGFRYVMLLDWPEEVKPENFTAIAVYSNMRPTFTFDSSDAGLNQIVQNTYWSVKGNFLDVPTDCPTRERAGWTGDAQLFFNTGNYMMEQKAFFRKWMRDVADCQKENGLVYNINPVAPGKSPIMEWLSVEGSAGWGDAMILIPYYFWQRYGDDALMRELWENMERCFTFYKRRMGKRNLLSLFRPKRSKYSKYLCACGRDFGEWTEPDDCAPPKSKMMIPMAEEATAYLSYTARLMAKMAGHLGKGADAKMYQFIADKTKEAYNYYFVQEGNIETNRMCKYVRPCGLGLAEGKARERLLEKIVELNRKRGYKIGTGFLTTPFVLETLSEAGEDDDAYRMLMNPELGWMQQVNQGATTVWENWTPDASLNHYSKGACCQWLFDCVCGIRLDERQNHFVIAPHTVGALERISLEYDSEYGKVYSGWEKAEGGYTFHIEIPANCEAELKIPGMEERTVAAGRYEIYQKGPL